MSTPAPLYVDSVWASEASFQGNKSSRSSHLPRWPWPRHPEGKPELDGMAASGGCGSGGGGTCDHAGPAPHCSCHAFLGQAPSWGGRGGSPQFEDIPVQPQLVLNLFGRVGIWSESRSKLYGVLGRLWAPVFKRIGVTWRPLPAISHLASSYLERFHCKDSQQRWSG